MRLIALDKILDRQNSYSFQIGLALFLAIFIDSASNAIGSPHTA